MAHHGVHRREPQQISSPAASLTNIGAPQGTGAIDTNIASAPSVSAITVITSSVTIIPAPTNGSQGPATVMPTTISVTNSAQLATLQPSTVSSSSQTSQRSSATSAAASSTSSVAASKGGSSNNLSTLIPAIVVPIAVLLIASFAAFWFYMRRRHRKELKNTEFVMAGKGEKLSSRSNSSRSGTMISNEKSTPAVTTSEFKSTPQPFSSRGQPKISLDDIGLARPLTPKDTEIAGSGPRSPASQQRPSTRDRERDRGYQNFSGPRPNTARQPPPSRSGQPHQSRSRSNSSPGKRGPPPSAYPYGPGNAPYGSGNAPYRPERPERPERGPPPRSGPSPTPRSGPSPTFRGGPSPQLGGPQRGLPMNPRPAPSPPGPPANSMPPSSIGRMRDPSPTMGLGLANRAPPPTHIETPPQGAYNGASSISQYSPIIKETPQLPAPSKFEPTPPPKTKFKPTDSTPAPIQTRNLTTTKPNTDTARSQSPVSPSFLSEENMRIARLANSSRLGFLNSGNTTSPQDNSLNAAVQRAGTNVSLASPSTEVSSTSPKLPPPATRSQLIPSDSPRSDEKGMNYFSNSKRNSMASSHYPPTFGNKSTTNLPMSRNGPVHEDDRNSIISDLDAYEDIDAKSDVSSLNEFERFNFDDRSGSRADSQLGSVRSGNDGSMTAQRMGPFG